MKVLFVPADPTRPMTIEANREGETNYDMFVRLVGGSIEYIPTNMPYEDISVIVDEEGKMKGKPFNNRAHMLWESLYNMEITEDVLVGNIVVTGGANLMTGEDKPIQQSVIDQIEKMNEQK